MKVPLPRVRPDQIGESVHGGADALELAQFGLRADDILDFSANLNPYAPLAAFETVSFDRYPERDAHSLRARLAQRHGVSEAEILVGNGSSELIWLAALA